MIKTSFQLAAIPKTIKLKDLRIDTLAEIVSEDQKGKVVLKSGFLKEILIFDKSRSLVDSFPSMNNTLGNFDVRILEKHEQVILQNE